MTYRTTNVVCGLVVTAAATLTSIACGDSPTQATVREPAGPPDFIVATGMNVLPIGGNTSFEVTAYTRSHVVNSYLLGIPQREDISPLVTWSSDNPAVASFRSGSLTGRGAGHANVTARYMGQSHTLPVDVVGPNIGVQQFVGKWSGTANVYCQDLRGSTRCDFVIGYFGGLLGPINVTLSLTAVGGVLQGSIDLGGRGWSPRSGAIVGGISEDGTLVIGGQAHLFDEGGPHQLRDWHLTRAGNTLIGSGLIDESFVNVYGPVWTRERLSEITLQE